MLLSLMPRKWVIKTCLCLGVLLSIASYGQVNYWKIVEQCNSDIEHKFNLQESYQARGDAYYGLGKYEKAIRDYKSSIAEGNSSADIQYNIGICYFMLSSYDTAIKYFHTAIKNKEDLTEAYIYIAECYKRKQEPEKAIRLLKGVIKKDSLNANVSYNLGLLYREQFKYQEALHFFALAKKDKAYKYFSLLNLVLCYSKISDFANAENNLKEAQQLDPSNSYTILYEGILLSSKKDKQKACNCFYIAKQKGNREADSLIKLIKCEN
ncbi:MAG: tetratricopeptide repeat protein [Bacteroidetes bacterium]|nr:tetratricopeptide repeat protein [Bacteroidota bacterium]